MQPTLLRLIVAAFVLVTAVLAAPQRIAASGRQDTDPAVSFCLPNVPACQRCAYMYLNPRMADDITQIGKKVRSLPLLAIQQRSRYLPFLMQR